MILGISYLLVSLRPVSVSKMAWSIGDIRLLVPIGRPLNMRFGSVIIRFLLEV